MAWSIDNIRLCTNNRMATTQRIDGRPSEQQSGIFYVLDPSEPDRVGIRGKHCLYGTRISY